VPASERETFRALVAGARGLQRLDLVPLVLGRLASVNGESLRNSADPVRAMESRDEHKLSYRAGNDDNIDVQRGAWWPPDYAGPPLVAMEDREADQLGLSVGDRLRFEIMGEPVEARLAAIYGQRRFQSRFWLEAIFTDGVLDPFITRYVGAAFMDTQGAIEAQERVAQAMPGVVTIRTAAMLAEARALLARASAGLAVVGAISLLASMLVLVSVVASTRARQVYDATVLHILGTRIGEVRRALRAEYALIALLTSLFAVPLGSAIAIALLRYRLELPADPAWWLGVVTALGVSIFSLTLGARYLLRRLRVAPAALLRAAG
jgi:putative ABC transport system permease protein